MKTQVCIHHLDSGDKQTMVCRSPLKAVLGALHWLEAEATMNHENEEQSVARGLVDILESLEFSLPFECQVGDNELTIAAAPVLAGDGV